MPGQMEGVSMPSDLEDPRAAALAKLVEDNPDFSPREIAAILHGTEEGVGEMTDYLLANVDFGHPEKAEQFFADFVRWIRENKQPVEDQNLTEA